MLWAADVCGDECSRVVEEPASIVCDLEDRSIFRRDFRAWRDSAEKRSANACSSAAFLLHSSIDD